MKLIDLLAQSADASSKQLAVQDMYANLSYSQLREHVLTLADVLIRQGCGSGIKVAILLPNSVLYFVGFFAVSAAQGTIIPMSSHFTPYEAINFLKRANVSLVITEPKYRSKLQHAIEFPSCLSIITLHWNSPGSLEINTASQPQPMRCLDNHDVALMVYTSGSTGHSKIVMLTDEQLISNMLAYRSTLELTTYNRAYCTLPLHHIYTICAQILPHISFGHSLIIGPQPFFIKDFLGAIQNNQINVTALVPTLAKMMTTFPRLEDFDLTSLKMVSLSGAKTSASVYTQLTRHFPYISFINMYGMSEAGSRISAAGPSPLMFPIDSVGRPIHGVKVDIVDRRGCSLKTGVVGEIAVKSSGVFKGYYKEPKLTKKTLVGGWLKTGDLGKLDEHGNLYLVGRAKHIIISGGENIYPGEIEECLMAHPDIHEAVVVGMPDDHLEQVPCAFVVSKSQFGINHRKLSSFCMKHLSAYKVPRRFIEIENFPKLTTGKIDHNQLERLVAFRQD